MSVSTLATAAGQHLAAVSSGDFDTNFNSIKYSREMAEGTVDVPASVIKLSLDGDSGLGNLVKVFIGVILELLWGAYQLCIRALAWFADFAMGLGWLETIRAPFDTIQDVLQTTLQNYNLYAIMLLITAFICVMWMARGRWAMGIAELFVALVVANYAIASIGGSTDTDSTPVSAYSPIDMMLGSDGAQDGLIYGARDFGTNIIGQLDGQMEGEDTYNPVTPSGSIVKTFLWYPVQLVNFGQVLSPECQDAYAIVLEGIAQGNSNDEVADKIRNYVPGAEGERAADEIGDEVKYDREGWAIPGACQHDDGDYYEDQRNLDSLITQWIVGFSVAFLGILIIVIAGAVILAGVNAVLQCLKVLLALLLAIFPRGGRRSLWVTLGSAVTALLILAFAIIFLGTFLVIIQEIFNQGGTSAGQRIGTFLLVDVLMIVGVIIFWRGRKSVAASKEKMADALSKMTPQGGGGGGGFSGGGGAGGGGGLQAAAQKFHLGNDIVRDVTGGKHIHDVTGMRRRGGATPGGIAGARGAGRAAGGTLAKAGAKKGIGALAKSVAAGAATGGSTLLAQGGYLAAKGGMAAAKKGGTKLAKSGAARAAGSAVSRGAGAVGRSGMNAARAAQGTRFGTAVGRAGTRARGRMNQFGALADKGKAGVNNKFRSAAYKAGQTGYLPGDVARRGAHNVRRGVTEAGAEMTGGRFGTAEAANRSRRATADVAAGEVNRNYERQMRRAEAGQEFADADTRYKGAKSQADLRARRHQDQAQAEKQAREDDKELKKMNRQYAKDEWRSNRGR